MFITEERSLSSKPWCSDGSYIIAGSTNNVYTVIPEKGISLKCDRACINAKSKICEHNPAAAEHIGAFS